MQQHAQNTALLVMDMQDAILGMLPDAALQVTKVAGAIAKAREGNLPVIYVTVGFRQGMPEISMNNKSFVETRERYAHLDMTAFTKVHQDLAPLPGDITMVKRRVSAFTGSDLEVVLRGLDIKHLVLCGVATSGVVLSTLREAADKDYRITVLADCCADRDEEVQRVLMTKVFPRQAEVIMLEAWS